MSNYIDQVKAAAEYLKSRDSRKPEIGIILGSGLGKLADQIENQNVIPYKDIPGFPISTAIGHKGNLIFGEIAGKNVIAMQGRFHYYEGYSMQLVTMPVRVMSLLGVEYLFVSNAAGGLNPEFRVGDIMLIKDHVNMAPSPLIGPNLDEFGPRFPDMSRAYDVELVKKMEKVAADEHIEIHKGVYIVVTGPTYETPAECRAYRFMGGDAIGMSTVPEVIVARHCGIKCMGMSIITDVAIEFCDDNYKIDGDEIVLIADKAADKMAVLFTSMIKNL